MPPVACNVQQPLGRLLSDDNGCPLLPVLFNIFLENLTQETLHTHNTFISIGGRSLSNLYFADGIDLIQGSRTSPTDGQRECIRDGDQHQVMIITNGALQSRMNTRMNTRLENVNRFKYLIATLFKDGSYSGDTCIRIATATTATARLMRIWRSNKIRVTTKYRLCKYLVDVDCARWYPKKNPNIRIQDQEGLVRPSDPGWHLVKTVFLGTVREG